ncbi:hypothetical protein [Dactylosporangium sp. CA-233914]|uniref:hypothetical protein n=1 Tax=Dactylosporangium sp. CA-233914 TaxID=3239934 RepID=UPI003D912F8E
MSIPQPDPRMRDLDFFVGDWHAAGRFHDTPFGAAKPIEMRIVGTSEDRGFWTVVRTEELATENNPAPLTARYVWGYDAAAGEFVAEWFDGNGGRATQRSKGWEDDRLVFLGTITMGGHTVPLRDTFTRTGPDHYHHVGETDLGNGWLTVDDEDATRVPDPR